MKSYNFEIGQIYECSVCSESGPRTGQIKIIEVTGNFIDVYLEITDGLGLWTPNYYYFKYNPSRDIWNLHIDILIKDDYCITLNKLKLKN